MSKIINFSSPYLVALHVCAVRCMDAPFIEAMSNFIKSGKSGSGLSQLTEDAKKILDACETCAVETAQMIAAQDGIPAITVRAVDCLYLNRYCVHCELGQLESKDTVPTGWDRLIMDHDRQWASCFQLAQPNTVHRFQDLRLKTEAFSAENGVSGFYDLLGWHACNITSCLDYLSDEPQVERASETEQIVALLRDMADWMRDLARNLMYFV